MFTPTKHPYLYFFDKGITSQVEFSEDPSGGSFNLERALAGLPCWEKISPAIAQEKRKIILSDWRFNNAKISDKMKYIELLEKLFTQGFDLYFTTRKTIKRIVDPFTIKETIEHYGLEYRSRISILEIAKAQFDWHPESLFVLGDHPGANALLIENQVQIQNEVFTKNRIHWNMPNEGGFLVETSLHSAKQRLEFLCEDGLIKKVGETGDDRASLYESRGYEFPSPESTSMELSVEENEKIITIDAKNKTEVCVLLNPENKTEWSIHLLNAENVSTVFLETNSFYLHEKLIYALLSQLTNLKILILKGFSLDFTEKPVELPIELIEKLKLSLSLLEEIYIETYTTSIENFLLLLGASNNLKRIYLNQILMPGITKEKIDSILNQYKLKCPRLRLESLSVLNCEIQISLLSIEMCQSIKRLHVNRGRLAKSRMTQTSPTETIKLTGSHPSPFDQIEFAHLAYDHENHKMIEAILKQSSGSIGQLCIQEAYIAPDLIEEKGSSLNLLSPLTLSKIKGLKLKFNFFGEGEFISLFLDRHNGVEFLSLEQNHSQESNVKITSAFNKLRYLALHNVGNLSSTLIPLFTNTKYLSHLSLELSRIHVTDISDLIPIHTPQKLLTTLFIRLYYALDHGITAYLIQLAPKLDTFELLSASSASLDLSNHSLKQLCLVSTNLENTNCVLRLPQLRSLTLDNCYSMSEHENHLSIITNNLAHLCLFLVNKSDNLIRKMFTQNQNLKWLEYVFYTMHRTANTILSLVNPKEIKFTSSSRNFIIIDSQNSLTHLQDLLDLFIRYPETDFQVLLGDSFTFDATGYNQLLAANAQFFGRLAISNQLHRIIKKSSTTQNIDKQIIPPSFSDEDQITDFDISHYFNEQPIVTTANRIQEPDSYSQMMLIEKMVRYLTIESKDLTLINIIKIGICSTLCKLYLETEETQWAAWFQAAQKWSEDNREPALEQFFELILTRIKTNASNTEKKLCILSDRLDHLAETTGFYLLSNLWHEIAVISQPECNTWTLYDPNSHIGPIATNHRDALHKELRMLLGDIFFLSYSTLNQGQIDRFYDLATHSLNSENKIDHFLRMGGLFYVSECDNLAEIKYQLLNPRDEEVLQKRFSEEAIKSVLLQHFGQPLWIARLITSDNEMQQIICQFLEAFILLKKENMQVLIDSFEKNRNYSASNLPKIISIIHVFSEHSDPLQHFVNYLLALYETYKESMLTLGFQLAFLSDQERPQPQSLSEFLEKQIYPAISQHTKLLVSCSGQQSPTLIALAIIQYFKQKVGQLPVFYVDSPDALICPHRHIKTISSPQSKEIKGKLVEGYGGPLYEFLMRHKGEGIIIVNYNTFTPNDIARTLSLLDKPGCLDETPLPPQLRIMGILNENNEEMGSIYQGNDFYSRFDEKILFTPHMDEVSSYLPEISKKETKGDEPANTSSTPLCIQLDGSEEWASLLKGGWRIQGTDLVYSPGKFADEKTLAAYDEIHLINPPQSQKNYWGLYAYLSQFLMEKSNRYKIYFIQDNSPDLSSLKHIIVSIKSGLTRDGNELVLNSYTYSRYFQQVSSQNGALSIQPGLLEINKNRVLSLVYTHALSEKCLFNFLRECDKWRIKIHLSHPANLTLPGSLHPSPIASTSENALLTIKQLILITSNDVYYRISCLQKTEPDLICLCISNLSPDALFEKAKIEINTRSDKPFHFQKKEQILQHWIRTGKKILLHGEFSESHAQAILDFFYEKRHLIHPETKIVILSDSLTPFQGLKIINDTVSPSHIYDSVSKEFDCKAPILSKPPLDYAGARALCFYAQHEAELNQSPWLGFDNLSNTHGISDNATLLPSNPLAEVQQIESTRQIKVNLVMNQFGLALLTGASAVGKTSYVRSQSLRSDTQIYMGIESIHAWANNSQSKRKILFLDEVNLQPELNSLLLDFLLSFRRKNHGVLYHDQYYHLDENHFILCAANPLDPDTGRNTLPIFMKFGLCVFFNPLSNAQLYLSLIQPIMLAYPPFVRYERSLSEMLLRIYRNSMKLNRNKIYLGPRELEWMLFMAIDYHHRHPQLSPEACLAWVCKILSPHFIPDRYLDKWKLQFNVQFNDFYFNTHVDSMNDDFYLTDSRQTSAYIICEMMKLRKSRMEATPSLLSSEFALARYRMGGINGLILRGEPAVGKSHLLLSILQSLGMRKAPLHFLRGQHQDHYFYYFPANLKEQDAAEYHRLAFMQGAVILIDEFNASPNFKEDSINHYLNGLSPQGELPKKPGHLILATANPNKSHKGRKKMSPALKHRILVIDVPNYTEEEYKHILAHWGVKPELLGAIAKGFIAAQAKNPKLTLRKLKQIALQYREEKPNADSSPQKLQLRTPTAIRPQQFFKTNTEKDDPSSSTTQQQPKRS